MIEESSARRAASCDSIRCFCAAFSDTMRRCSECAVWRAIRFFRIAALNEVTCLTMLASACEAELIESILVEQILEARRAEEHRQGRVVRRRGRVGRHEPCGERVLRELEVRAGERQLPPVLLEVAFDLLQLDVGEVVRLDRRTEAAIDLIDLRENLLRLGLLRLDARVRRSGCRRNHCYGNGDEERLRLSSPPAGQSRGSVRSTAHRRGPVRHKWGTLATSSDVCNRFPSLKVPNSHSGWTAQSPGLLVSRPVRWRRESRLALGLLLGVGLLLCAALTGARGAKPPAGRRRPQAPAERPRSPLPERPARPIRPRCRLPPGTRRSTVFRGVEALAEAAADRAGPGWRWWRTLGDGADHLLHVEETERWPRLSASARPWTMPAMRGLG